MSELSSSASSSSEAAGGGSDFAEIPDSDKTPVTIVTGFLGSGKTTLVNYILKEQTKWKICVVENEFGEVSIDNDLVEENLAAREDIITMDNGCVCCSIRGDLVRTFGTLVQRRKDFDAIIIETTGMADPSPIVFTFNSNSLIQDNYRIDSVVCLVDAKHIDIHLDDKKPEGNINEAEHQVAFSDCIVINKTDLVTPDELESVIDRIRSMNSFAKIIRSERSRVPLDQILGISSFSLEKVVEIDPTLMDEDDAADDSDAHDHASHGHDHDGHTHDEHCGHETDHGHGHGHEHSQHKDGAAGGGASHDHGHDHGHGHGHEHDQAAPQKKKPKKTHNLSLVSSVGFTITGDLDVTKFNNFMTELLKARAADLYRTKGVLSFADQGDQKFVFQGVHEQINFGPTEKPWNKDEERISKMVFIGKNLDYPFLQKSLQDCTDNSEKSVVTMHKRG